MLYDLEEHAWVHGDIRYHSKKDPERIAARAKHSVTAVFYNPGNAPEFTDKSPHCVKWTRRLWFDKKLQKPFNPAESHHFRYGMFIFGGLSAVSEKAMGDLWLLQPHTQINESTIVDKNDPASLYRDRASAYLVGYNVSILAFNISNIAKGRPPVARFAHQALSISNGRYLVISGGRNNDLYRSHGNIALNDLNLFNTQSFEWEALAMYGHAPLSRWNHGLVATEDGRLILFGGLNMTAYMSSSRLEVFEFGEYPVDRYLSKAQQTLSDL